MALARHVLSGATVYRYTHPCMCDDATCGRKEKCMTNYSVSDVVVCLPFACTQKCADGAGCEFCVHRKNIEHKLQKLKLSGILFAMADIFFDETGAMCAGKNTCDLAFLDSATSGVTVLKTMSVFKKSRGFRVFCDNLQTHILEQILPSQRSVCTVRTQEMHDARRALMFRSRYKRKFDENDVVANNFGSIMFRFEGFSRHHAHNSMTSLRDEDLSPPAQQHDPIVCMECGMNTVGLSSDRTHSEVQMSFPCHVDFVLDSKKFSVFLVKGEQSIIVKKTIETASQHACVGEQQKPAEYLAFETRTLKERDRQVPRIDTRDVTVVFEHNINQENVDRTSRRQRDTDDFMYRPVEFLLPIFFRVLIYHAEFDVLDSSQKQHPLSAEWLKLNVASDGAAHRNVLSHSEAYILSMLFPDSTVDTLNRISTAHCTRENKCEEQIVEDLQGMIQSLYVEITPVFTLVKDICMDVVMGILKISTGIFWHREHVHRMIHLISYMDRMVCLPSGHAIEPYVYSHFTLCPSHTACILALRKTHASFSKHLFSETIGDIVVDVFCGGDIFTHPDAGARDLIVDSEITPEAARKETVHRLGAPRAFENERQVRHTLALLKKSNGIYNHTTLLKKPNGVYDHTALDERIYKIRDMVTQKTGHVVMCTLVNSFVKKCKLNRVYARVPLGDDSLLFRNEVMAFLENVDACLDGIVGSVIDAELARFQVQDELLKARIQEFITRNTAPANRP